METGRCITNEKFCYYPKPLHSPQTEHKQPPDCIQFFAEQDTKSNLEKANSTSCSNSYHCAKKRKAPLSGIHRTKKRKIPTCQNINVLSRIQVLCHPNNSTFDIDNIEMIADSIGDSLFIHVSNCAVLVYKGSNIVPDNKFLSNLILDHEDFKAKCNTESGILLYKDDHRMLYSVAREFPWAVRNKAGDISYSIYFDTTENRFVQIHSPKTNHRSKTFSKTQSTTKRCTIHKQSRYCVILPRPISLYSKKRAFDGYGKKHTLVAATPFSGISYNSSNYPQTVIAQASDSSTESGPIRDDLSLVLPHLSTQSSDGGAGGIDFSSNRFQRGLTTDASSFIHPILSGEVLPSQSYIVSAIRGGRSYDNTAYTNFIDIEARRASFTSAWPHSSGVQNFENMVQCGFFSTGNGDLIRCYQCGIGLKDWGPTDDPLTEHVRYSPNCQYIIDVIPSTMLRTIKASFLPNNVVSTRESVRTDSVTQATDTGAGFTNEQVLPVQTRNPQYVEINVRISSFSKWPRDITQTPEELAEAGFFYTGCNDIVRCFACDGGLQKWSPGDSAWVEHARWFPHCSYVRVKKGEDFIELVRLSAEQDDNEEDEPSEAAGGYAAAFDEAAIGGMNHLSISDRTDDTEGLGDIKKAVCEAIGCSEEIVTKVVRDMKLKGQQITQDSVANYLLEGNLHEPHHQSDYLINFQKEPKSVEELIDEREKLRSVIKCQNCKDNDANCLFLPCAHHRFCVACSKDILICPMCQQKIKNKVKTFMS